MNRLFRFSALAAASMLYLSGVASAQNAADRPDASDVTQQFKSGVTQIGTGATHLAEGIKQGAIMTW